MSSTRTPADPGDVRFETGEAEEGMEETPYFVEVIDDSGDVIETHWFESKYAPGDFIASWREHQARCDEADRLGVHPLEIAFAPFGPEWAAEQQERSW